MIDKTVYILDNDMRIIKIDDPLENVQTTELPEDQSLIKNYVHVAVEIDEKVTEKARFLAMKAKAGSEKAFEMFEIINEETNNDSTNFVAVDIGVRETGGYIIKDFRPSERTVRYVAEQLLEETDWRVGYVDSKLTNISTNFYYLTVKDSLVKLQQVAGCEILFRVEISDNEITDKWIEIHEQIGQKRAHRFEYGTSVLEITRQSSTSELYTALIGRGKGEESGDGYGRKITFTDVEASDKPLGQEYIENELATAIYGIRTIAGMVRRTGLIEYDTDDEAELLELTRKDLEYVSRPKSEFKTTVDKIGDADIGDSATIHKYENGLHYETRIRKVVRDRVNNLNTDLVLGDYVHDSATKKQARTNSTIKNIEISQDEQREVIGNVIQSADGKNTNFYGNVEPERKKTGDTWFRDHPSLTGESQILVWNGEAWELIIDTSETTKNAIEIKTVIEQAQADRTELEEEINQTYEAAVTEADRLAAIRDDGITITAGQIRAGIIDAARLDAVNIVTSGLSANVVKANHIQADSAFFDKLFTSTLATDRLSAQTAWIKNGMFANASIDGAKIQDATIGSAKIANLDVGKISGNTSNFVQSAWNAINSRADMNATRLRFTHSDGTSTEIGSNGIRRVTASDNRNYHYLVSIHTFVYGDSSNNARWVQLPNDFKGKSFKVYTALADSMNVANYHRVLQRMVATHHPRHSIDYANAKVPVIAYKSESLGDGTAPNITNVQGMLIAIY